MIASVKPFGKFMFIYFLRHAETKSNRNESLSSCNEDSLTPEGLKHAKAIVGELMELQVEKILCSPYSRAIDTITPFSTTSQLLLEIHPCLAEGQLILDNAYEAENPEYCLDGTHPVEDETPGQFLGRAKAADILIRSQNSQNILVVTHGHMIRELMNIQLNTGKKIRFPHDNCGLSCIFVGEHIQLKYANRILGFRF